MNNRRAKTSLKKYTSHFIARFACERELETEQRLQYIDPHSYQRCIFLVLLMLHRRSGGSAFCWLSLPHLVSNSSDPQLADFPSLPSYIIVQSPTQSPTQSLEWHV